MKSKTGMVLAALSLSMAMITPAYAQGWESDSNGWTWKTDDGARYTNCWQWIDGNNDDISECYYFDDNGYMLSDTTTPDGYTVNADGAWLVDGVVQTIGTGDQTVQKAQADCPKIDGVYLDRAWGDTYYACTLEDGTLQILFTDESGTKGDVYMSMSYLGNNEWSDGADQTMISQGLSNHAWLTEDGIHISMYGYMQRWLVKKS